MFSTVSLRGNTANVILFAECEDCRALLRPEEAVLLQHEATHRPVQAAVAEVSFATALAEAGIEASRSVSANASTAQVSGEPV